LNDREARKARALIARVEEVSSARAALNAVQLGIPHDVWEMYVRALAGTKRTISSMLENYELLRRGEVIDVARQWQNEPGIMLIIARIARDLSQADLARQLGMREQQIQRYEAERYRSISLQSLKRIAATLGVAITATVGHGFEAWLSSLSFPPRPEIDRKQLDAILAHGLAHDWFEVTSDSALDEGLVYDYIDETNYQFGSPGLLRTGLKSLDLSGDALLAAWRARVLKRGDGEIKKLSEQFDQVNLSWVPDLVRASAADDGPRRAVNIAREHGVVIIVEPQIAGVTLDGAAFLLGQTPVIGITLRHDRIDNFWFTLMHEVGHVFVHYNSGLSGGFFDEDLERESADQMEEEANQFASSMLVPPERWRNSTVRIARSAAPVEKFAKQLGIHPAIVFGKIRKDRDDYRIFTELVGLGQVRRQFLST
jgi:HTH-type transcriptional regulator/antitoxin HigA